MPLLVGIIGKPNVGKSTFFASSTLMTVPIADFPFTTIKPNVGVAYLRTKCVCTEMGVKDRPRNSVCVDGVRLIPVKLVDVAGLVEGASSGRGLGNQFLDELRQADALIHVVDASGSTDIEGRKVEEGTHSPVEDVAMVEREFDLWMLGILTKDWERAARVAEQSRTPVTDYIIEKYSGLGIGRTLIEEAMLHLHLKPEKPLEWSSEELAALVKRLRETGKPSLVAANKSDLPHAKQYIERLRETGKMVVPCASEAELLLRKAAELGLISYKPGDGRFDVLKNDQLSPAQQRALDLVKSNVLDKWGGTGVQQAIDQAYFGLLKAIVVFPVEDEGKLSDKNGNVLPDAHVMSGGSTAKDLAARIHSDLAASFLYAIDVRSGKRLSADYALKNGDIIKIVSSGRRG